MFVSQVGLSEDLLARLIVVSSRTTSRSTTVSESVMSALSSIRPGDEMILEEKEPPTLAIHDAMAGTAAHLHFPSSLSVYKDSAGLKPGASRFFNQTSKFFP